MQPATATAAAFAAALALAVLAAPVHGLHCHPTEETEFGGKCHRVYLNANGPGATISYEESKCFCAARGGVVSEFHNDAERTSLFNHMKAKMGNARNAFLGAQRELPQAPGPNHAAGAFRWNSGADSSNLAFGNPAWSGGEPNNCCAGEACMQFWSDSSPLLNDIWCDGSWGHYHVTCGCDGECPEDTTVVLNDSDGDGTPDACDNDGGDSDGDGILDYLDVCFGNNASGDSDGDGVCDDNDQCVGQDATGDSDYDGTCDDVDLCTGDDLTGDVDGDGICGNLDVCDGNDASGDSDSDGVCDDLDDDDDNDGTPDNEDCLPTSPYGSASADGGSTSSELVYLPSLGRWVTTLCPDASCTCGGGAQTDGVCHVVATLHGVDHYAASYECQA